LFLKQCAAHALPPDELQIILADNMIVPAQIRGHLLGRPAPYEKALKKITVPVLISHGVEDRVALVPMVRYTASVVARAPCSIYQGVGHLPFWEAAPRFNRELAEFVRQSNKR
jgi:pimeloyl-ACP methyl ester carboxylesterase